ncbi:MAG: Holliday junction branch migration protein RuvA [Candidatus Midichloria sp.]|nr:MAG: Holliday junction branch migration protein RuvA [Candidatus Midichloria sp.]
MIGKLTGEICLIDPEQIIIDVAGVGYVLNIASSALASVQIGQTKSFWVHTQVKEEKITLFGFTLKEEKQLFETLITVQGVGGKVALAILSSMTLTMVTAAIIAQDINAFKRVNGVGPKLAARIVNELKDKKALMANTCSFVNATASLEGNQSMALDTASVLANLGFVKSEAFKIAADILKKDEQISLEDLIKKSLSQITKV